MAIVEVQLLQIQFLETAFSRGQTFPMTHVLDELNPQLFEHPQEKMLRRRLRGCGFPESVAIQMVGGMIQLVDCKVAASAQRLMLVLVLIIKTKNIILRNP